MIKKLKPYYGDLIDTINISGSKSESNRLLILQHLFKGLDLENLSNSDDTKYLNKALQQSKGLVDISHAGTAMRFLTAYFACKDGAEVILTGSDRMQNRPIKVLVDALQSIGADISYVEKKGYPPLRINGKQITAERVEIDGNVSSQYISALLLVAPSLRNGLQVDLRGEVTSRPYILMTLSLLEQLGVTHLWEGNSIKVNPLTFKKTDTITVESDWSSASYYYSLAALGNKVDIHLTSFKENSLQGDSKLVDIYKEFGVVSIFNDHTLTLKKVAQNHASVQFNLIETPDLAQTIAVTCLGLNMDCQLAGLHTLKIKETDRLVALKNELEKLGGKVNITSEQLELKASETINADVAIDTYQDHRMAMAFAPLALKVPLQINEANVVSKSYPNFWSDLRMLSINFSEI